MQGGERSVHSEKDKRLELVLAEAPEVILLKVVLKPDARTREIRKVRFVANFECVPQVLTQICLHHQKKRHQRSF